MPLGSQERGGCRAGRPLRDPGGVRHRGGAPAQHQRGNVRHRQGERREDREVDRRALRPAPRCHHPRFGSEEADLPQDGGLRALRARGPGLLLGEDGSSRGFTECRGIVNHRTQWHSPDGNRSGYAENAKNTEKAIY